MEFFNTFWVGGLICVVGQLLIDFTKLTPARILVLFVTAGVALTAVGLYEPLVAFAGAGATVPWIYIGNGNERSRRAKRLVGRFFRRNQCNGCRNCCSSVLWVFSGDAFSLWR